MIESRMINNLIYSEMSEADRNNWFALSSKKFLHNIDTFYYSVKLVNDFTKDTTDEAALNVRKFFDNAIDRTAFDACVPIHLPGADMQLNIRPYHYAGFYNINIECPDMFDIFIADTVPPGADGESVTSEIMVQLRSCILWQYGVTKAFEHSYKAIKALCDFFKLEIIEVKENRADFCWHSNYIQNPENYFRIDNFAKMQVSRYRRIRYEYAFKPDSEYENDYISLGKRGDKCFVRIYLKSKEVVEKGYKPWFFKEWLLNGLINRYDYYVYEAAFLKNDWRYCDTARLKFYAEYGADDELRSQCAAIAAGELDKSYEYIHRLADRLTPRITLITNVEYQTMRKMSKSFELRLTKDNEDKGVCRRIYDYLDNRYLITEYLTHSTLRLVNIKDTDINKSRADYTGFWKSLRSCRMIDVKKPPKELKLTRDYTRKMNKEVVKKRLMNSIVTFSLYEKGINRDSVLEDCKHALTRLNDNDIYDMRKIKDKRITLLNNMLFSGALPDLPEPKFKLLDAETGEVI